MLGENGCTDSTERVQRLGLERTAATARFYGLWVVERESPFFDAFVEIDGGAVQVEGTLLIDNDCHSMVFVLGVDLFVELGVKAQRVTKPAAASAGNAYSQNSPLLELLVFNNSLHFAGGFFG